MDRRVFDLTLPTLAENLAFDEALLLDADSGNGGEALRFWEWPALAIVLGASGRLHDEVLEEQCLRDGVPIQRRASGGGTVLLGKGCLLFNLVLSMEEDPALRDIHSSYRHVLNQISCALETAVTMVQEGISDLAVAGMKVCGSAQQRKRNFMLLHGTLLHDFDIAAMGRYLRIPSKQPSYRQGRPHESFVTNLQVDPMELKRLIRNKWGGEVSSAFAPSDLIANLLMQKYSRDDWIRRR